MGACCLFIFFTLELAKFLIENKVPSLVIIKRKNWLNLAELLFHRHSF